MVVEQANSKNSRWGSLESILLDIIDYSGKDYRLNSTPPAVAIGEDLSSIFTDDLDITDRGSGVPFDLGAFQYQ